MKSAFCLTSLSLILLACSGGNSSSAATRGSVGTVGGTSGEGGSTSGEGGSTSGEGGSTSGQGGSASAATVGGSSVDSDGCVLGMSHVIPESKGADLYVDGLSGSDSNSGSSGAAFKTLRHAVTVARGGDTIHLLPTVTYGKTYIGAASGTSGAPITIKGDGVYPNLTKLWSDGTNFALMLDTPQAAYVNVQNLDIKAPGPWSGIFIQNTHHINISNNVVHDSGNSGISTRFADYLIISHNTVYGNAGVTSNLFGSGISTYQNLDIDNITGIKSIIDGNLIYDNTNTPTSGIADGLDSDGSGIILDDLRHTQSDNVAYKAQTLVSNNIIFNNGGRGISVGSSDNAIIVNNTLYHNNQDPYESGWHPGELTIETSANIQVYNNICFGAGSAGTTTTGARVSLSIKKCDGDITVDYNLFYNDANDSSLKQYIGVDKHANTGTVNVLTNNLWNNPLFVKASIDPALADFHVQSSSPTLGTGTNTYLQAYDFAGAPRPACGPYDMGAYK